MHRLMRKVGIRVIGTRERAHRSFSKVMDVEDINRIIMQFADAAIRCLQGGMDADECV